MATHSRFLPGKSHGQRSLVGCNPWGCKELDTTECTHTHTHTHTQVVIIEALQPRVSARNIWELGWGHESPPQ